MSEEVDKLLAIWDETYGDGDEEQGLTIVEEGEWIDDGKYSYRNTIVKWNDKFWNISESRSGSYHTDYYYNDPEAYEVTPRTETITRTVYDRVKA